jgi:hypothetical protein
MKSMSKSVTEAELDALRNLQEYANKAMRSKPTLRLLTKLQDKGMIEFDPFGGSTRLTDLGRHEIQ